MKTCFFIFTCFLFISTPQALQADDSQPKGSGLESSSHVFLGKIFKTFNQDEWAENEFQTAVQINGNREAYRELASIYSERSTQGNQAPSVRQLYQKKAQEMSLRAEGRSPVKEKPRVMESRIQLPQVERDIFGRDVEQLKRQRAMEEAEAEREREEWRKKNAVKFKKKITEQPLTSESSVSESSGILDIDTLREGETWQANWSASQGCYTVEGKSGCLGGHG